MTIGNLAPMTWDNRMAPVADLEQERLVAAQAGLVVNGAEPLNCETPVGMLGGRVAPTAQFYRRNHFPIPVLDEATWRLDVSGMVHRPLSLSLHELTMLPAETMAVTLECAGNSRRMFRPLVPGEQWGFGAVGTAEWTGVLLADVLRRAGIQRGAREVIFGGADRGTVTRSGWSYPAGTRSPRSSGLAISVWPRSRLAASSRPSVTSTNGIAAGPRCGSRSGCRRSA